jgi:ATP-dependent protease ClpP protease subunit
MSKQRKVPQQPFLRTVSGASQAVKTPKAMRKPCFCASLQSDGTLELLVYEDIGESFWTGGGVTAKSVKQQLDDAGAFSRIAVRINSPGGDAFEGSAILSLLKAQKKPVDVYVDGIAASAASIIAMAGNTITMGRTAMMMVHNAWTFCAGNADELRQCADVLDKISTSIGQAYVDKTGKTSEQIKAIMDAETWMSAQECVDEGFATSVAADDEDDEAAMALARSFKSLAKLKKVPDALKPKAADTCACDCAACMQGDCANCDVEECDDENCVHEDDDDVDASNLSQYEARLKVLRV